MRYMIITYWARAQKNAVQLQQDEVVEVAKQLRDRQLQTASVILDFKQKQVVKANLAGQQAPRDWQRIRDYYYQHYAEIIDQLEQLYHEKSHNTH